MGCTGSSEKEAEEKQQSQKDQQYDGVVTNESVARDDSRNRQEDYEVVNEEDQEPEEEEEDNSNVPVAGQGKGGRFKGPGPVDLQGNPLEENDGTTFKGIFKNGLLWKIVRGDEWFFYNDTEDLEMHANWSFGPRSEIEIGSDVTERDPGAEDEADWLHYSLIIYPGETKVLITGKYDGYKNNHSAKPLGPEYRERLNAEFKKVAAGEKEAVTVIARGLNDPTGLEDADELLERCVKQGVPFVDLHFPPEDNSLSRPGIDRRQLPSQAWRRPTHYLDAADHDKIRCIKQASPDDIDQGQLGDCWFLCSVASLAEFPEKIKDIFRHPRSHANHRKVEEGLGAYHVTLNKNGWWQVYVVDSYFPTTTGGKKPCYAKCCEDPGELWVSLLEKAYAKAHGSYASITGGDALHALQDLTGYPINRFDTEWEDALKKPEASDELFSDMLRYDEGGYLINLNTPGQDNSAYMGAVATNNAKDFEKRYQDAGLGMGHAYSVLTVKEFDVNGGKLKLLKIRNPWGNGTEWTGAWSDDCENWKKYPQVAKGCDFTPGADGTFWMEWEDCKAYFDGGGVCFMRNNWFDYRVKGAFVNGYPNCILEIRVTKPIKCYIVLSQKDKRGLKQDDPDKDYAAMLLSVSKGITGANGQPRQQVHLNSSSDADKPTTQFTFNYARDLALLYEFEPADLPYCVIPRKYNQEGSKDYVLGIISEAAVEEGVFDITFKTLDKSSKVFQNYPKFDYNEDKVRGFETQYQYNPEVGCPVTKTHDRILNVQ